MTDLNLLLQKVIDLHASDLHLNVGLPPMLRIDGALLPLTGQPPLTPEDVAALALAALSPQQKELYELNKEVDLSMTFGSAARFRVNAFTEQGRSALALRLIPLKIPSLEELGLPPVLSDFAKLPQGLVLVTGPTGHGKSTTIAALIDYINSARACHVITIEDPIEYVFAPKKAIISQREMYKDTMSWNAALKSALREDPEVVFIGEMRDYETIAAAVTIAETGHLVFATLHTNSASQTIDRVIDVFPEQQQNQIRSQLASILEGVISQRLLAKIGGGRVAAAEVLLMSGAVRNLIREAKTYQISNVIATSYDLGMISLERSLASLIKSGKVSLEEAVRHTLQPEELRRLALS